MTNRAAVRPLQPSPCRFPGFSERGREAKNGPEGTFPRAVRMAAPNPNSVRKLQPPATETISWGRPRGSSLMSSMIRSRLQALPTTSARFSRNTGCADANTTASTRPIHSRQRAGGGRSSSSPQFFPARPIARARRAGTLRAPSVRGSRRARPAVKAVFAPRARRGRRSASRESSSSSACRAAPAPSAQFRCRLGEPPRPSSVVGGEVAGGARPRIASAALPRMRRGSAAWRGHM